MLQTDISGDCWLELFAFPALSIFFMDENKVVDILPARFIGGAYEGDCREEDTDIFAVGDDEYLVPVEDKWKNGHVIESKVRLDQVKKIEIRPVNDNGVPTREIPKMKLSDDVSPEARESLRKIISKRFIPEPHYKVQIVEPK